MSLDPVNTEVVSLTVLVKYSEGVKTLCRCDFGFWRIPPLHKRVANVNARVSRSGILIFKRVAYSPSMVVNIATI